MIHGGAKYSTDNVKCLSHTGAKNSTERVTWSTEVLNISRTMSKCSMVVLNVPRRGLNVPRRCKILQGQ